MAWRLASLGSLPCAYPNGHPVRLRGCDASGRARTRSSQSYTPALKTAIAGALASVMTRAPRGAP
eukprot:3448917-Prymnesium_polylepis.1